MELQLVLCHHILVCLVGAVFQHYQFLIIGVITVTSALVDLGEVVGRSVPHCMKFVWLMLDHDAFHGTLLLILG